MLARIASYLPTAVLAFLIFYFGFQALTGDRGLLSTTDAPTSWKPRARSCAGCAISARILRFAQNSCATTVFRPTY